MVLKLKVGGVYRDGFGSIHGPMQARFDETYSFKTAHGTSFTAEGYYHKTSDTYPQHNLVEEVIVTPAPKPATGVGYMNIYRNTSGGFTFGAVRDSITSCKNAFMSSDPIARAKVEWEEGVFAE